jgi:hypothetical protein
MDELQIGWQSAHNLYQQIINMPTWGVGMSIDVGWEQVLFLPK